MLSSAELDVYKRQVELVTNEDLGDGHLVVGENLALLCDERGNTSDKLARVQRAGNDLVRYHPSVAEKDVKKDSQWEIGGKRNEEQKFALSEELEIVVEMVHAPTLAVSVERFNGELDSQNGEC